MNCNRDTMLLYAVTDRTWCGHQSLYEQVECALRGGVSCVQLREKALDRETFLTEAREIHALCRNYNVPLIINDHVDIALQSGAEGGHVGQDDMNARDVRSIAGGQLMLGVSAHTVQEALDAEAAGADYLGCGSVFATSTKSNVTSLPHDVLREICTRVHIPVVAIGGISRENLPQLAGCGVAGVALVSAIFAASDIEAECRALRALSKRMVST